jgi:hypothetical protein
MIAGRYSYLSGDNLDALNESPVDAYIATDKGEKQHKVSLSDSVRKLVMADFDYNEETNSYTCPGEQELTMQREERSGKLT